MCMYVCECVRARAHTRVYMRRFVHTCKYAVEFLRMKSAVFCVHFFVLLSTHSAMYKYVA